MKMLTVFLQFGASISDPLSSTRLFIFWGVIIVLVLLFVFFLYRTNKIVDARKESAKQKEALGHTVTVQNDITEETAAAIGLAIHMYKNEMHDQESFTITLKKVSKIYSPWSSKIYTLRQNPR
jgi:Na+-transporting methylmalonyl-CoA/oxaloacetate decarboxylase gamma subunit